MKSLKIVFMGTPEFAVYILKAIYEAGYPVQGVVTAPDRPAGRGRTLQESPVKKFAKQKGIPVLQPTNLKSEAFLTDLRALQADLQVVVAFRMLPRVVWDMPPRGTFNLHASLLPQYRGAAPINWAVINGENTTGVSTFFLDDQIDTGRILLQEEVPIGADEDAGSLHDRLMHTGANLVLSTLEGIEGGSLTPIPQKELPDLKSAPKLYQENTRIQWDQSVEQVYNLIRGLSPYPGAWSMLLNGNKEYRVKIFSASKAAGATQHPPGTLIQEEKKVKIAARDGYLFLETLQLPGKKKMAVKDLLNGYEFYPNAKMR